MLFAFRKVSAVWRLIVVDVAAALGLALLPVLSPLRRQAGDGVPGMSRLWRRRPVRTGVSVVGVLFAFRKVSAVRRLIAVDVAAALGLALLPVLSPLRRQAGDGVLGMSRLWRRRPVRTGVSVVGVLFAFRKVSVVRRLIVVDVAAAAAGRRRCAGYVAALTPTAGSDRR